MAKALGILGKVSVNPQTDPCHRVGHTLPDGTSKEIDVDIICEQYKDLHSGVWVADESGEAAIWTCRNLAIEETSKILESDFIRVKIRGISMCSCDTKPDKRKVPIYGGEAGDGYK